MSRVTVNIVNNYIFSWAIYESHHQCRDQGFSIRQGTFVTFDKGSTSADPKYANAIRSYLPNIEFNKSDHESIVTVPFNFREIKFLQFTYICGMNYQQTLDYLYAQLPMFSRDWFGSL